MISFLSLSLSAQPVQLAKQTSRWVQYACMCCFVRRMSFLANNQLATYAGLDEPDELQIHYLFSLQLLLSSCRQPRCWSFIRAEDIVSCDAYCFGVFRTFLLLSYTDE